MVIRDEDVARDPWRGVYLALRHTIVTGEYPPGSRLVEQELADRFRTSRGPVRTALQELERSGLVVSVNRRGTFVREITDEDVEEISSLWKVLYDFMVRRAIERMSPDDPARLEALKTKIPSAPDPDEFLVFGVELTSEIFRIAQHGRALEIFNSLMIQAQARSIFFTATGNVGEIEVQVPNLHEICDKLLEGTRTASSPAPIGSATR